MNIFEVEKKILKAQTPDEIDAITEGLDNRVLRDLIKLIIERMTPVNIKMNRLLNQCDCDEEN